MYLCSSSSIGLHNFLAYLILLLGTDLCIAGISVDCECFTADLALGDFALGEFPAVCVHSKCSFIAGFSVDCATPKEVCVADFLADCALSVNPSTTTLSVLVDIPEVFKNGDLGRSLDATVAGNATLSLASQLLHTPWVVSLPLDDPGNLSDQYCEAIVVALHVAGSDPSGAVTALVLAVPEGVASAVADIQVVTASAYHPADPEDPSEELTVGLVVAEPAFLAGKLSTSTPSEATLVTFSETSITYPWSGELFVLLELNDLLSQGSLIHADVMSNAVRVRTDGYESEGAFHSAGEEESDLALVVTQLTALGVKRRKLRGKQLVPSLLGLGAASGRMSDLM
eukprot:218925-Amphidinium_carterae.1